MDVPAEDSRALRFRAMGVLCLLRTIPLLKAGDAFVLRDVKAVVEAGTHGLLPSAEVIESLLRWRNDNCPVEDFREPEYLQAMISGIAVVVAGAHLPGAVIDDDFVGRSSIGVWDCCDQMVRVAGGGAMQEFKEMEYSLSQIESLWQGADWRALAASNDILSTLSLRRQMVDSRGAQRMKIVQAVADCAGWNSPGFRTPNRGSSRA